MKIEKNITQATFNLIKFLILSVTCVFFVLIVNHFYQIKNYLLTLSNNLDVIVFFNKDLSDYEKIKKEIESTSLLSFKKYVNASEAYSIAIEKNPFLKDISISNDIKSIQAYAIVTPKSISDESFILEMKKKVENISDVEEIVFDSSSFKHYVKTKKNELLYQKIFFVFGLIILIFFGLKCIFVFVKKELNGGKFIKDILLHFLVCAASSFLTWFVCVFMQYTLLIDYLGVLGVIFIATALGIVLDRVH
ncbi:MAG: hypothetical protein LBL77_00135 [Endomicrobium sp.]|jgi:cell division transport system permease protein|nr:hypothetical protein [Endomicrobium sp.]